MIRSTSLCAVSLLVLASVVACGGSSATTPDQEVGVPTMDVPTADAGGVPQDGGKAVAQDAAPAKDGAAEEPAFRGSVVLAPASVMGSPPGSRGTEAAAAFVPKDFVLSGCAPYKTIAGCSVRTCPGPVSPNAPHVESGTITISGAGGTIGLDTHDGPAPVSQNANMQWIAGALFSVTGAGSPGGLPAFAASVTVPAYLDIVSTTALTDVSRASDLALDWTGDEAGTMVSARISSPALYAECAVPSSFHVVTVPQAVLALAGASDAGEISLEVSRGQKVQAGSTEVDVIARVRRRVWNVTFH